MTFAQEWERAYQAGTNLSIWPWSDLVSFVLRYARPAGRSTRVLELGFGAGANIPFFSRLEVDYTGIEGSSSIVEEVRKAYPALSDRLLVGDFTGFVPDGTFDLVVDRSSLTHNDTDSIRGCLDRLSNSMPTGSKYVGIDWFSTEHEDAQSGTKIDSHTRDAIPSGQFAGVGTVHFSDAEHLKDLFEQGSFRIDVLQHKQHNSIIPQPTVRFASWNLVATRV